MKEIINFWKEQNPSFELSKWNEIEGYIFTYVTYEAGKFDSATNHLTWR